MNKDKASAYYRAQERVKEIKGFYTHVFIFIAFSFVWWLLLGNLEKFILSNVSDPDKGFINWVDLNTWLTPSIWGIALIVHGIYVFTNRFNFLRNWEEKKIQEYMAEEGEERTSRGQWE